MPFNYIDFNTIDFSVYFYTKHIISKYHHVQDDLPLNKKCFIAPDKYHLYKVSTTLTAFKKHLPKTPQNPTACFV